VEKTYVGAQGLDFTLTFLQRCLLAGRALWFYIAKLIWPENLTFIYPRWTIDTGIWWQYLFSAGILALLILLWFSRKRTSGLLAGLLYFIVTLFPVMGFLNVFPFIYSYVADHFQYFAVLGIIIPAAAGFTHAIVKLKKGKTFALSNLSDNKNAFAVAVLGGVILLSMAVATWKQNGMYVDMETLWRTTVVRNPHSLIAHHNLGQLLLVKGQVDEAISHFHAALAINPDHPEAIANLGSAFTVKHQYEEAINCFKKALELKPNEAIFHESLGNTYLEIGKAEEAAIQYEETLRLDPSDGLAADNLAWILATCPKDSVRNGKRAVELALKAIGIIGVNDPTSMGTLAAAYAETGRFKEAIATQERAYELALTTGDKEFITSHKELLEVYQAGLPHREASLK